MSVSTSSSSNKGIAVVTGASSGLGKVYADRLAKRGYLNSVCYNSITEQGQMFWIAAARGRYGSRFDVLSMLSISSGISIDPVETVETGETVDSKNRQQTCGFGANRMKSEWGRSSVG